jgi:hypothetical protein
VIVGLSFLFLSLRNWDVGAWRGGRGCCRD